MTDQKENADLLFSGKITRARNNDNKNSFYYGKLSGCGTISTFFELSVWWCVHDEHDRKSKISNHHRREQTKREENTGHYVVKNGFMKAMNSRGIHMKVLFTFNRSFWHYWTIGRQKWSIFLFCCGLCFFFLPSFHDRSCSPVHFMSSFAWESACELCDHSK